MGHTLIQDNLRSLLTAGEWHVAAQQAATHKGIGRHLWSGRQAVVLALLQDGHAAAAAEMVDASETTSPDDQAIQALLHTFCALDGHLHPHRLDTAIAGAHRLIAVDDPATIYFRTQTALTATTLTELAQQPDPQLREATISAAAIDAYASRAVLEALGEQADLLRGIVAAGGLGCGAQQHSDLPDVLIAHADTAIKDLRLLLATEWI